MTNTIPTDRTDKFERLFSRAEVLLAEGFGTKAAKKAALEAVSYAYESAAGYDFYDAPHSLNNWRPKHAAAYPVLAPFGDRAFALRGKIAATEVVAKPKVKTAAQLKKDAESKTCQVCGRPIFAEVGVIAHHGYTRPGDGWQTASCSGARELPFEADRAVLGAYIERVRAYQANAKADRKSVAAETTPIVLSYEKALPKREGAPCWERPAYETIRFSITRKTFAAAIAEHGARLPWFSGNDSFDGYLARDLAARDAEIKATADYIKFQQGRYDGWEKTFEFVGGTWVAAKGGAK